MTPMDIRTLAAALLLAFAAAGMPAAARASDGTAALPAWDQLTQAQRDALVAPLRQRWDEHPEQRARMLQRAERWKQLGPEQRERARRGAERWQRMDPEKREAMRALYAHMRTLPEAERETLRQAWRAMTPAERRAWVQAHPAPADAASPPPGR